MSGLAGHLDSQVNSGGNLVLAFPSPKTYRIVGRKATRPYAIGVTLSPGKVRALLVFQHGPATTRNITIRHIWFAFESNSAANIITVDLVKLIGPLNDAHLVDLTPVSADGAGLSECSAFVTASDSLSVLALEDYVFSSTEFNIGATNATASIINPPVDLTWVDLLDKHYSVDGERTLPKLLSGVTNDLWAITGTHDSGATSSVIFYFVIVEFTEE